MMLSVYQLRFSAVQDHFRDDHNRTRYMNELKELKRDIGKQMDNDDDVLKWTYRAVSRELGFISSAISSTVDSIKHSPGNERIAV